MRKLALSGLEMAMNRYLALDPDTIKRLSALKGKVIKVEHSDWDSAFYILPYSAGVHLVDDYEGEPDTTIKGKLVNLMRAGMAGAKSDTLFENQIEISGDTEVGEAMRDILQKMDIDWEEHVSHYTGDIVAHKMSVGLKSILAFGKQTASTLADNVKDYLHEEARAFPSQKQAESFYKDIAKLRNDVERADARLEHLLEKIKNKHTDQDSSQ